MSAQEEKAPERCEKCDREARHMIELTAPDNSVSRVCWTCFSRGEKRISTKDSWRRQGRAAGA
ncbi:MAG: hypothetical protein ACRD68_02820 [Pyrinomonadaceae bacterium]